MINQTALGNGLLFVAWFLGSYYYHGLGITLGYHRLLTHKALRLPRWLEYLIVSGGYLALMGAPISWVGTHRLHHQKSDLPGDPHSPRDGFKHALYEWMFTMRQLQPDEEVHKQVQDMINDPVYKLLGTEHTDQQAQLCLAAGIVFRLLILVLFGPIAFVANLTASIILFWSTQLVNAACHLPNVGYRSWDTRDTSKNVWWVGILACGEGWHNNHHGVPKSAQHGMQWFEVDITWYTIWLLEKLGLAKGVIRPPKVIGRAVAVSVAEPQTINFAPEPTPEPVLANSVLVNKE